MKTIALTLILTAGASATLLAQPAPLARPSASKESSLVSQDPLMRQILHRQLTQRNGGITAAVRIASGQSIELQVVDLDIKPADELKDALNSGQPGDPEAGLAPAPGLIADQERGGPAEGKAPAKKPSEQLKALERQGLKQAWGGSAKVGSERLPAVEAGTAKKHG